MDRPIEAKFQSELLKEERLLWTGQPGSSLFVPADLFLVPFSLLWGGFAIFWEVMVLRAGNPTGHGAPRFFVAFGAVFVLFGLYFVVGRFFYKAWRNRRTVYAVTNRRVLVLTETGARKIQAALIHNLAVIHKRIRADGSGTLTFGASSGFAGGLASMYDNTGMDFFGAFYGTPPPAFHAIPDAERVYRLVAEQQGGA
jgi:hypothetical protein